ncbi:MAG: aminopeptidase [Clostridia bacterium]|nr:aminopeptidase [Clostridia bacterium]
MKKTTLKKYAKLIVRVGANVQKGQPVLLYVSVDQHEFAAMVAEECYRAGASRVDMEWSSQAITKLTYRHQSLRTLSKVPAWKEEKLKLMAQEYPCRIHIASEDPDGLKGLNMEKVQKASIATYPILKPYRDAIESMHQWTIAAVPSPAWAKKVFPELKKNQAVEALWNAILSSVHVSDDADNDPIAEWAQHNENFRKRCAWLNAQKFEYLTYKSANGTDFRADLIPQGQWCGGGETTKQGVYFNPNLPTEEIFTSPMAGRAEGTLVSTKPLSYQGQMIENFWIRFENGAAVEWDAEVGKELLDKMLSMDEGANKLGELALIPKNSPINESGILFYETLFDENASCHVALGAGFNDCIEGHLDMTNEECRALGINDSMIHVDFMIGADDMEITGWKNGVPTPVFVNGTWAQEV